MFASRLWLISLFGSDVPFWDQWDAEGAYLYKPLLEHGIGSVDWFAGHGEHRIFTTRVTDAVLLFVNKQWDPLVQGCWNAGCAALIAALLCLITVQAFGRGRLASTAHVLVIFGTCVPFGWENTLAGFQTCFFYVILLSLAIFSLCARQDGGWRSTAGIFALAVLAVLTLAAGVLTCLAAASSLVLRTLVHRGWSVRRDALLIGSLIFLALLGLVAIPVIEGHAELRAHSLGAAWISFNNIMGWPTRLGVVIWTPAFAWLVLLLRSRRMSRFDVFLCATGAFVVLNAAGIAYARVTIDATSVASRYLDIVWLNWLVNLWALLALWRNHGTASWPSLPRIAVVLYLAVAVYQLVGAGQANFGGARDRGRDYVVESNNVREYLLHGRVDALQDKHGLEIPYPESLRLQAFLNDSTIREVLPPGIRPGVLQRSIGSVADITAEGLVQTGVPFGSPPAPEPIGGYFWGTFGKEGDAHVVDFRSPLMTARGTDVWLMVSGFLGKKGTALYLEDESGNTRVDLSPGSIPGRTWQRVQAHIPAARFRLVAIDRVTTGDGWFAFSDPIEIGPLRGTAETLIRHSPRVTILALALILALLTSATTFAGDDGPRGARPLDRS